MAWDPSKHARSPKGPGGGEFAAGGGSGSPASSKLPAAKRATGRTVPKGSLGFNGKTGTGYGSAKGDARVIALQKRLNAMGLKDADGNELKVDGKLGPKTTAAIKAWQRKNGQKPTGFLDAASVKKLTGARSKTSALRKSRPALVAGATARRR